MKKTIVIFLILSQASFIINAKFKMLGLEKLKNKVEKEIDRATKLTKKNFNKYIKKADDYIYNNKEDIFNFITTPRKTLEREITEELDKFNWSEDQEFINKFVSLQSKDAKLKLLNEKIIRLHPNAKVPILALTDDLMFESQTAKESEEKIKNFIEEQKKKKGFLDFIGNNIVNNNSVNSDPKHYFSNMNALVKRIAQMQRNMDIISNFLNNLLKF